MIIKAMLAEDADESKLTFPAYVQPKIDGYRAIVQEGGVYARSLKLHPNPYLQECFGNHIYNGVDCELTVTGTQREPDCCRRASVVRRGHGTPDITLNAFDFVTGETRFWDYEARYAELVRRVEAWANPKILVVPATLVSSLEELLDKEEEYLDAGYEGLIYRSLRRLHKAGRSTIREGGLLRIKRFVEEEAIIYGWEPQMENLNPAQIDERGYQFRSSHAENKVAKELVGVFLCKRIRDGADIRVSPSHTHDELAAFYKDPSLFMYRHIVYKHFPKGVKNKPRFAIFVRFDGENL